MKNNLIIKTQLKDFIIKDLIKKEKNKIITSSLYHYFCLKFNVLEKDLSFKTFNALFSQIYYTAYKERLKRSRIYINNQVYWYLEGVYIKNPFTFSINYNEEQDFIKMLSFNNFEETTSIAQEVEVQRELKTNPTITKTPPFEIVKGADYFKFVKIWLEKHLEYKEDAEVYTTELINHYCIHFLNGYVPEHTYHQFFIKELKKSSKELWPLVPKEVINSNISGKKGMSRIHNIILK